MKRITRKKLVQIVREVLSESKLSDPQRARLIYVAQTIDVVLLNAWYEDGCGCIVGTLLKRTPAPGAYNQASIAIDTALLKHTGIKLGVLQLEKLQVIG